MKITRRRILQIICLVLLQAVTLGVLTRFLSGLTFDSWGSAIGASVAYTIAQAVFWIIFIQFLTWLPGIFYPIITFILSGAFVALVGNLIPGVVIDGWVTGFWITFWLTAVNAIVGGLFSLDEDSFFDRNVTHRMVKKLGTITKTELPGFLFLEIDGLGVDKLRQAIDGGYMPTVKGWIERGTHEITGWETDFTSQTGAMQTGILLGNNSDVPAYRWWDRSLQKIVMSGDPRDAINIEKRLSTGRGLLSDGGASRGNMFSGDALESMLVMSTLLNRDRKRGPGFYSYLLNPYIISRLLTRIILEIVKEWWQAWQQKIRKDPYRVSARNIGYGLLRGFMSPFMQDLGTYMVISDTLRGIPAIYALYAGYDDLSHFAGNYSHEAFEALLETDRYFARIEKAIAVAPRPYHVIVLSDHGQTLGKRFDIMYQVSLEGLVDALMTQKGEVYTAQKTHETWDKLSLMLTEATQENTRSAQVLRSLVQSKRHDDLVQTGPQTEDDKARTKEVVVLGSGCAGLIYFTKSEKQVTYEEINQRHPDLLVGLVKHPGIGFVMVRSETQGTMVLGKDGIHFLDDGKVDGVDPLAVFGPNAARHLKREASFSNAPDILVNTVYDPQTEEMCGFENQVSHHGGLGGPQNFPFILHPTSLDAGDEPIVTAEGAYRVMREWREQAQNLDNIEASQ